MESPDGGITRRAVLVGAAQAAVAAAVTARRPAYAAGEPSSQPPKYRIWDAHGHLNASGDTPRERIANLLEYADRMGIERVVVFMGYPWAYDPSPDDVRRQNDQVIEAVEHSRGRALAFVYLNPKHTEESLAELDRCVRDGPMVGVKLWVAVRCHDKCLDPIVRRAAELKAPVLQHTWYKITGNLPGESTAADLAELAARHPTALFIAAHAGGDWERGIRAIRSARNVTAEISGGDPTAGIVEMAVRELGAERVMYGSDFAGRSFASQLAKVYGADVPEADKRLILGENLRRMLQPILGGKRGQDPFAFNGPKGASHKGVLTPFPSQGDPAMVIDVNVNLSRWPFRRLPCDELPKLLDKLRETNVAQAWAGSFDGLFHKDLGGVNARLAEDCGKQARGLLVPFGSVNPTLPDWREDLRRCHEEHGMPGIRLHPNYHGYGLDNPLFAELLGLAERRGLIVQLVVRIEDIRMQHPLMRVPDVDVKPLPDLVAARPNLRLVMLNAPRTVRGETLRRLARAGNVYFEIAMLEGVGGISKLLGDVPPGRVLFGSHFPFFHLEAAVLKLRESDLLRSQAEAVSRRNAERLLHAQ